MKTKKLGDAVGCCSEQLFPNISTVLQLLLTLPVGSCSCERSFSGLRRLKTWSRTSMATDRLTALALLYVHRNSPVVTDVQPIDIVKKWDESLHRRIALAFDPRLDE